MIGYYTLYADKYTSLFPATSISGVHLYWGCRGASNIPVHFCDGAQGCSRREALLLTKHLLSTLYLPHLSFRSILSLTHDLFVLFPSALPSILFLIPSLFPSLDFAHSPQKTGVKKKKRNGVKTRKTVRKTAGEPETATVYVAHSR